MNEPAVLQLGDLARQEKFGLATAEPPKIPFRLQRTNPKGFAHEAILNFVNEQIGQVTATLLARAIFPDPKPGNGPRIFRPNMFVRVRMPTSPP